MDCRMCGEIVKIFKIYPHIDRKNPLYIAKGGSYFVDYKEQYDKIYQYCYFRLQNPDIAEDITQEVFLRFLENDTYEEKGYALHYLYTIARNLCIEEYRKKVEAPLEKETSEESFENICVEKIMLRGALEKLTAEEQELILLRYVNEVPISVLCKLQDCSRFALYRKINTILKKLKKDMSKEGR